MKRTESNESSFYFPNMVVEESKRKASEHRNQVISEIDSQFEGSTYKSESPRKSKRLPSNYIWKESSEAPYSPRVPASAAGAQPVLSMRSYDRNTSKQQETFDRSQLESQVELRIQEVTQQLKAESQQELQSHLK